MEASDASRPAGNAAPDCSELSPRYTHTLHMCIDIAGVLRWPDNKLRELFKDENGFKRSGSYVRDFLKLELMKGKKVLPMCDPKECPDFDHVNGCPGHRILESPNTPGQGRPEKDGAS